MLLWGRGCPLRKEKTRNQKRHKTWPHKTGMTKPWRQTPKTLWQGFSLESMVQKKNNHQKKLLIPKLVFQQNLLPYGFPKAMASMVSPVARHGQLPSPGASTAQSRAPQRWAAPPSAEGGAPGALPEPSPEGAPHPAPQKTGQIYMYIYIYNYKSIYIYILCAWICIDIERERDGYIDI